MPFQQANTAIPTAATASHSTCNYATNLIILFETNIFNKNKSKKLILLYSDCSKRYIEENIMQNIVKNKKKELIEICKLLKVQRMNVFGSVVSETPVSFWSQESGIIHLQCRILFPVSCLQQPKTSCHFESTEAINLLSTWSLPRRYLIAIPMKYRKSFLLYDSQFFLGVFYFEIEVLRYRMTYSG